jgi:signal transduction histidine kinase
MGHAVLAGLPVAAAAWLWQSWPAALALGALAAAGALALWRLAWRQVRRDYVEPMQVAVTLMKDLRGGSSVHRLIEFGAPLARALMRSVKEASAAIDERAKMSQANLMSVEIAFDRIHSVLHSLSESVLVVDVVGELVLANRCARKLLKEDGRPIEGRPLLALLQGTLREVVEGAMQRVQRQGEELTQVAGVTFNQRVYDLSVVRVRSQRRDEEFGWVIVIVDVTRNHEVARMKDGFLSSISHELRTPLTNISAFAEILAVMTPDDGGEWREFVEIIGQESRRLARLVDNVLDYNHLETGQVRFHNETFDVGEVARGVIGSFAAAAHGNGVTIQLEGGAVPMPVRADRQRVRQALVNLLDNAVKFTPAGGRIAVGLQPLGEQVQLSIDDSGPGVAIDQRENVFEKFSQLGDVLTEKPSGGGLGLAISRRIVDRMGGVMWCEGSALGGARFVILLPAADRTSAARAAAR